MKAFALCLVFALAVLAGCMSDAHIASDNLSRAADNFEITRRVTFINGITNDYMLVIEGRCSIDADPRSKQLEVTCRVSDRDYAKHFLGLSDNVTYIAEQLETVDVSVFHHRVIFKPQSILPDIDLRTSTEELLENASEFNPQEDVPQEIHRGK